jgi:uncharacterized protein involved in outer membrane biogenesis
MQRWRIPLIILAALIALAWGGAHVLRQTLSQRLAAWMSQALMRPVTMAQASIRLLPLSIQVAALRVAGPTPQDPPVLEVADAHARLHLPALLSGRILVREVRLNTPHIFVHRTATGGSNLPPRILPNPSSALSPPVHAGVLQLPDITWQVEQLIVTNGQADLRDEAANRTVRLQDLQIHIGPIAPQAPTIMDLAREEPNSARMIGISEIVDVAPIRRSRLFLGFFCNASLDARIPTCTGSSCNIDVESLRPDAKAKIQCRKSTLLTDDPLGRFYIRSGFKAQAIWVTHIDQFVGGKLSYSWHSEPPFAAFFTHSIL